MDTTVIDFRALVATKLQAAPGFAAVPGSSGPPAVAAVPAVPVLEHKTGDLAAEIARALNALRICAVVAIDSARETGNQTIRPTYEVRFSVLVVESVLLNKTNKDAWSLAFTAVSALKLLAVQDDDLRGLIEVANADIEEVTPEGAKGSLVVDVPFQATLSGIPRGYTPPPST